MGLSAAVCGSRSSQVLERKGLGPGISTEPSWLVLPSADWELSRLRRQCKVMEGERRAYSKEVHQCINKQL